MLRDEILSPGTYIGLPWRVTKAKNLSAGQKLIYGILLSHLGEGKNDVWVGTKLLQLESGLSKHTIFRATKKLEATKLLTIKQVWHSDHLEHNHYSFLNPDEAMLKFGTSPKIAPILVPELHQSSPKIAPILVPEVVLELLNKTTERTTKLNYTSGGVRQEPSELIKTLYNIFHFPESSETIQKLIKLWRDKGHHLTPAQIKKVANINPLTTCKQFFSSDCKADGSVLPGWKRIIESRIIDDSSDAVEYPARLAVDLWGQVGLNGIHDSEAVVRAITPAVASLRATLSEEKFVELLVAAFDKRKAANWRAENPSCQSIEWMFKYNTEGGKRVYNVEKAASGRMNWIDKKDRSSGHISSVASATDDNCGW